MSRYTQIVLVAIATLGAGIAVLALGVSRLGPSVDSFYTAQTLDGTLVNSQIAVTFSAPMRPASVERNFAISPRVKGQFNWTGNELVFSPRANLSFARTYRVTIGTGAQGADGKRLQRRFVHDFTTEGQHLLYLGTDGPDRGRLVLATLTGKQQVVGPNDGSVTAFSLSADRTSVVFVRRGAPGERADELWLLNLTDGSSRRLLRRVHWSVTAPALSPDGSTVVFLATNVWVCQKYYGCTRETSIPLIYFLDVDTGRAHPYQAASDTPISNFVAWTPDSRIAYTDAGSALVLADPKSGRITHVPNEGNSLLFSTFDQKGDRVAFVGQTPSSTGGDIVIYSGHGFDDISRGTYDSEQPSFSASGTRIVYSGYRGEYGHIPNLQPMYGLNVYDFKSHQTRHLTDPRAWTDWGASWSIDDRYIAFVRTRPRGTLYLGSGQVWVIDSNGKGARPIAGIGRDVTWVG